jgi:hypothetical protein
MQIGGLGLSAAGWLASVGKTVASEGLEAFAPPTLRDASGKKEPANPAASNTSFPTAPPVNLGVNALLALQEAGPAAQSAPTSLAAEAEAEGLETSAADQFLAYMKKSPEERLRDKILKALGVTEEDIANMSPEERLAIEKKVQDIIKETMVKTDAHGAPEREQAGADAIQRNFMLELI